MGPTLVKVTADAPLFQRESLQPCGGRDFVVWWREQDSNLRPLGYEPNELPLLHPAMFVSAKLDVFVGMAMDLDDKILLNFIIGEKSRSYLGAAHPVC